MVGPWSTSTMPKKKTHPGRGQGKNKKKHKYKPLPDEGAKKDEEEKIEVNDKDQANSSTDTASGPENGSAEVENPVAAADESSRDGNVKPTKLVASCNEPLQVSPIHFTAREHSEAEGAVALMPEVAPVPRPALSLPLWLPSHCRPSVPGFALNTAPRAPFRPLQPPPPPATVASRSFPPIARPGPPRAIKQEDADAYHDPPSPESVIKHPLANKWTLWWFCKDGSIDYESCQKPVSTVSTVEDFWALFHHTQPASELKTGNDYSLFKEGIRPLWEHKRNCSGGRWLHAIGPGINKRDSFRLDSCWREVLLLLIGEDYGDDKMRRMVNGVVINLRKMDKLAVWMDNVDEPEVFEFGRHFQRAIGAPPMTLTFEAHQDTMAKKGSASKATYRI